MSGRGSEDIAGRLHGPICWGDVEAIWEGCAWSLPLYCTYCKPILSLCSPQWDSAGRLHSQLLSDPSPAGLPGHAGFTQVNKAKSKGGPVDC